MSIRRQVGPQAVPRRPPRRERRLARRTPARRTPARRTPARRTPARRTPAQTQLRLFAAAAGAAGAFTVWEGRAAPGVLLGVAVAMLPWALLLAGVRLPLWLFTVLALAPVAYLVAVEADDASMFLATAAVSRVAAATPRWQVVVPVVAVAALLPLLHPAYRSGSNDAGGAYFAFGVAFGAFVGVLLRRETVLTVRLQHAQDQLAAAAAAAERRRIARDVHDIVGHSLTVVVLHIAGARRMLRDEPATAEEALQAAERVGRESLDAIRDVVGLLRDDVPESALGRASQQAGSTFDLDGLVESYRSAGGAVEVTVEGEPAALPVTARATVYRFVQEALTNITRHGNGESPARLSVRVRPDVVEAEARNEVEHDPGGSPGGSAGAAADGFPGGYGLRGMRERVAALGGELGAGRVGTEWVVSFRLPLRAEDRR